MEIRTCEQYVLAELERVRAERRADELDAELERYRAARRDPFGTALADVNRYYENLRGSGDE